MMWDEPVSRTARLNRWLPMVTGIHHLPSMCGPKKTHPRDRQPIAYLPDYMYALMRTDKTRLIVVS